MKNLETRINQLENTLIDLAMTQQRCKYIYRTDITNALLKNKIIKKKPKPPIPKKTHYITDAMLKKMNKKY